MKIVLIFLLMLMTASASNAQLLQKIKDKAAKAVEPKKESSNSTGTTASDASTNGSETAASNSAAAKAPSTPPANGSVVFTLAGDESLLYDESKIITKNNKLSYSFVVQNRSYEYFLIEDGKRSGPMKQAPLNSVNSSEDGDSGSGNDDAVTLGNDNKDAVGLKYSKTIDGKLYLVFNGKNYGPYDFVAKMILSPDAKHFFALVTIGSQNAMMAKMGMGNAFIVNDAGLKQKAGSGSMVMPTKFSVSEGFKHAMATVMDQQDQKIITVTSAGKQSEGSLADMYTSGENKTFVSENGDIICIPSQSPTQVLVNGKEAAAFKVPIKSMDRLFLTPDISKSVYYEKGKIYRADGSEENLTGVLFPRVTTVNNETAVYYFKIFKNESGNKDVYLCKKVI
jgi:hypothetical protein